MSTRQRVSDKPQFNQSYRSSCIRLCLLMVCIVGALTLLISTEITKLLNKLTKEKGNEDLQPWVKPCERHLYWSATSTQDGNGRSSGQSLNHSLAISLIGTPTWMTPFLTSVHTETSLIVNGLTQVLFVISLATCI